MKLKKIIIRILFVAAALLTLLAVVHLVEGFRGRRAWAAYESEDRAKGVKLDLMEYVTPTIPDSENYAAIPLFQEVFTASEAGNTVPNHIAFPKPQIPPPKRGDIAKAQAKSLTAWRDYFVQVGLLTEASDDVPGDVLRALATYDPYLEQVREASSRPHTHFPVNWQRGFAARLPHLQVIPQLSKILALRASAHLAGKDSGAAYEDVRLGLRLYEAILKEPVLISGLIRMAVLGGILEPVWEGLIADQWGDPELAKLSNQLLTLKPLDDLAFALNSERGGANFQLNLTMTMPSRELAGVLMLGAPEVNNAPLPAGARLAVLTYPRGWLRQNQVLINRLFDDWIARIQKIKTDGYNGALTGDAHFDRITRGSGFNKIYYFLARMLMPALTSAESRFLIMDTRVKQAAIACALQRHRHVKATYPEKLDELIPDYLVAIPLDVFSNRPMSYRRDAADRYTLWSVGANQKDDGGTMDPKKAEKEQADLVWSSSAAEPAK
jgi:hypothetical protein